MEEFEKWWEKAHKLHCWGKNGHDKRVAFIVWKAALEWVCNNEFDIDAILYELRKG